MLKAINIKWDTDGDTEELLNNRKENHANLIIVSTNKNKDLFKGNISELPEELLNIQIFAWDKRDGIYITIE